MKVLIILVFSLMAILALGQSEDAVFTVKAKQRIELAPNLDTLHDFAEYRFDIYGISLKDITAAVFTHGTVSVTDTTLPVHVKAIKGNIQKDTLWVYANRNGKQTVVLEKIFTIVKRPSLILTDTIARNQPIPNVVLLHWHTNRRQIFKNDKATVSEMRNSPDLLRASTPNQQATITSYKMDINCGGAVQKFTANNASITKSMRDALNVLTPGCIVKLYEIKCIRGGSSNDENIIGPYSILVTE